MRQCYDVQASKYRGDDELHVTSSDHARVCCRLKMLCKNLASPLNVLDLGCGTGRHFHCLQSIVSLTAVDVSPKMLEQAKAPVMGCGLDIQNIRYICGDFYSTNFSRDHFGLVYSFGVFGNGCALNASLANRLFESLRPGGCFFFDVPDASTLSMWPRLRRRLRGCIYHALPDRWQARWDSRAGWLPAFLPTKDELVATLAKAGFVGIEVKSEVSHLPSGVGKKFECLAWKTDKEQDVLRKTK